MNILDFYKIYQDIKECDEVIKSSLIRSVQEEPVKDPHLTKSIVEDECGLCMLNRVNKIFRCKVSSGLEL